MSPRRLLAVTNPADHGQVPARVPELIVLIDWDTLKSGVRTAGGVCELSDGTPLPVSTVRQIACDANIIPVVLGGKGREGGQALPSGTTPRPELDVDDHGLRLGLVDGLCVECAVFHADRPLSLA